jgi:hypothetical protein
MEAVVVVVGQRAVIEEVRTVAEKGETVSFAAAAVAAGVAAAVVAVAVVRWMKVEAVEMVW